MTKDDEVHSPDRIRGMPVYAKYGEASRGGFQAVPDLLFKYQSELGVSATELVVLLNITMHRWSVEDRPFPSASTIAKRMGVNERTVQRSFRSLEKLSLVERHKVPATRHRGKRTEFNLEPLVRRLNDIAPRDTDYLYRNRLEGRDANRGPHPVGTSAV